MTTCNVNPIGTICNNDNGAWIEILPEYRPALQALDGFSHINVIWWFSECDNEAAMGIFATRSPARPNPLALTAAEVLQLDLKNGIIRIDYTDANDGTPVLDIKPYTPSMDRVESPRVPKWCGHWPKSREESADFAWENEFNF